MKIETKCLHEGYKPENGGPSALPIVQSTTYRFDSTTYRRSVRYAHRVYVLPLCKPDLRRRRKEDRGA